MAAVYLGCIWLAVNCNFLQAIISVSQLLGDAVGLNNARFQESLSNINNYANSDKAMQVRKL